MPFMIEQPYRTIAPAFVSFGPGFTSQQARTIVSVHGQNMERVASCAEGHLASYRKVQVRWGRENAWIYRTFQDYAVRIRKHAYPFEAAGFMEPLELQRFDGETGDYSEWLMHLGSGPQSARKATFIAELSEAEDYGGGEVEVWGPSGVRQVSAKALGSFTAFPAYHLHRTKHVAQGTRWCLVGYLYGPPFT